MKKHKKRSDEKKQTNASSSGMPANDILPIEQQIETSQNIETTQNKGNDTNHQRLEEMFWSKSSNEEEKTREEEFDEYLADLLL